MVRALWRIVYGTAQDAYLARHSNGEPDTERDGAESRETGASHGAHGM